MKTAITKTATTPHIATECHSWADAQLNDRQRAAIRLLVLGRSISTTANLIEVDRGTIHRWKRTAAFRRALNQLRRQLWSEAADRLRALVHPSLDVLEDHLRKRHHRTRFRAANAVLRHANLKKCVPLTDALDDCEDDSCDYD